MTYSERLRESIQLDQAELAAHLQLLKTANDNQRAGLREEINFLRASIQWAREQLGADAI